MNSIRFVATAALLAAGSTTYLFAQNTRATVTGKIVDNTKEPVIGALVTVKNESTGFTVSAATDANGNYTIREIPLGSPYTITAKYIGYGDQKRTGYSLNQGDMLRVDFTMSDQSQELKEIEVVANSLKKNVDNEGASTSVTAQDIKKLPVNGRNFTSLIDLSPLSNGMNLSGQLASSTGFNIDGMSSKNPISGGAANTRKGSPYAMTMEAVREFKVVTNAYDVTYGRAGGGLINAVTQSGTNTLKGSAFSYLRTDWLASQYDILGNKRTSDFSTYQYGFSLGGPIIKDRLHFFVAWDHQQDTKPLRIADIHGASDESRYNLSQATLDAFTQIAKDKYGLPNQPEYGSFDKKSNTNSVFARIDWQINPTNLLSVRNNLNINKQPYSQGDNTTINFLESYSDCNTADNSLMASLRSVFGPKITNEAKVQWMYSMEETKANSLLPNGTIPRAIVQNVASEVDGKTLMTNIQIGGQRFTPENFHDNVYQFVDNLLINAGKINYTLGLDVMYSHLSSLYGSETNGRFYFKGLDSFNNMTPYRYARDVYMVEGEKNQKVTQRIVNAGIYGQLHTQLFEGFDLTAGVRIDNASYLDHGNYYEPADRLLGVRTDKGIGLFLVQPRLQLQWDINNKHTDILKLGGGIFASDINNYATVNSQVFDGSRIVTIDTQDASLIPTPNFPSYRQNPATAPDADLLKNPNVEKLVTINCNKEGSKVPTIYKANLSYTHYFSDRFKMGVAGYMTLARHNYLYIDKNMVDEPYFRLENEGGRGVYVPANTINAKGNTNWLEGRKTKEIGRVLELNTIGKVNQFAFVIDGSWRYFKDGFLSFSYTWNSVKDNNTYNGDVANTSTLVKMVKDDPRDMSQLSYGNGQFRHKLVVYGTAPTFWGIQAGIRFSGIGGTRYSTIVGGNVNGDFVATNDLAFIFDPNDPNTDAGIRKGFETLMANPKVEKKFKEYLQNNYGKMAERNGGVNGFYGTFDLHLEKAFKLYKTHALEVSLDVFNVANLLNKDWGVGKNLSNVPLYYITGFDQEKKQYKYAVNTNAGVSGGNGNPYQCQLGIRYRF